MTRYRVTAPVVVVKTAGDYGPTYKHLQQGAPVPDDAGEDWIGYHLRDHMIAEVPEDAPPAAPPGPVLPEPQEGPPDPGPPPVVRGRTRPAQPG